MRAIGANHGSTEFGKCLRDGGLAIIDGYNVTLAISEERLSRRKHESGQRRVLEQATLRGVLTKGEIGSAFWSGCCEPQRRHDRSVSHHLSHAVMGHCWSRNEQSLVIVMDDGGDCLGPLNSRNQWWQTEREQLSVYVVDSKGIKLVDRDFVKSGQAGLGELYRAFTYHLGWNSGRHAGKTMALASYGEVAPSISRIFSLEDGELSTPVLDLDPRLPYHAVDKCFQYIGVPSIDQRTPNTPIKEEHMFVAAIIQSSLEYALVQKVNSCIRKFGVRDIVLTGGVALNCRAAQLVAEETEARSVFVPPATSDQGQALGNALVGLWSMGARELPKLSSPFLGFEYEETLAAVRRSAKELNLNNIDVSEFSEERLVDRVAGYLFNGNIVFWYQGRAEYGARALGHRSILAAPFKSETAKQLNTLKGREGFMPFAASALDKAAGDLFIDSAWSPYMTRTFTVRSAMREELSAVVHVDGTCRAQIISESDDRKYYKLIEAFGRLSGVPTLLNTSLNGAGEPIVETPHEALELFLKFPQVKYCIIGNVIVERQEGAMSNLELKNE